MFESTCEIGSIHFHLELTVLDTLYFGSPLIIVAVDCINLRKEYRDYV